jgi:hypothetical protein
MSCRVSDTLLLFIKPTVTLYLVQRLCSRNSLQHALSSDGQPAFTYLSLSLSFAARALDIIAIQLATLPMPAD